MATTAKILNFIDTFCTEVKKNETPSDVELKMDDHDCIEFNEVQYYVPKNNSLYSDEDYDIRDLLIENYLI